MKHALGWIIASIIATSSAHADDGVDVSRVEFLDVIETSDGSIWRGVVVEQTPNESYKIATSDGGLHVIRADDVAKITKQRNKRFRVATMESDDLEIEGSTRRSRGPSGARIEPSAALLIPTGDISFMSTSFAPDLRVGYEAAFGDFAFGTGVLGRFIPWQGPMGMSMWTLEAHAYAQGILRAGRAEPYVGVSLGIDTNHLSVVGELLPEPMRDNVVQTNIGFGLNLQAGIAIAATPKVAFRLGADFHPGTDAIADDGSGSISYFAFTVGASFRP